MDRRADMSIAITRVPLAEILPFRDLYRHEMNCQVVHDSFHARGFTESFLVRVDGQPAGYGSAAGLPGNAKDVAKEFFLLPAYRRHALPSFRAFLEEAGAKTIEAQTNDRMMTLLLLECADFVERDKVLFEDAAVTHLSLHAAVFRKSTDADAPRLFAHTAEPAGEWLIEAGGRIVATGGLGLHYNPPYADIYMEVAPDSRRQGCGSYLVQELKRECYATGKIPAARCRAENAASRATLQKAGMLPCARILIGRIGR